MLNEKTSKFLLEQMSKINALFTKYGLGSSRIYEPEHIDIDDWNKINFLVDKLDINFMSHELDTLEEEIKSLLDCEVKVTVNTMVRDDFLSRISKNAVPYMENSKEKLLALFDTKLFPLAKRYEESQKKNGKQKNHSFEFFQEENSAERTQKRNKGESKLQTPSSTDLPESSPEQLLAIKLLEEHATEIQGLSPPQKEELVKHFCKSIGVNVQITPNAPAQRV